MCVVYFGYVGCVLLVWWLVVGVDFGWCSSVVGC